ncbi:MAG: class I SAM-dependent methyltransferase [Frankiaceae bacterium]
MPRPRGLLGGLRHAAQDPQRARRYLRRLRRDLLLRLRHRDHIAYYRAVMRDTVERGEAMAVGNSDRRRWHEIGQLQFDYLRGHGLAPQHRMLEIGCGNLRAGWRFIDYLDAGNYYGLDISPEVLLAAQETLVRHGLAGKLPYLTLVTDMRFAFLPDERFDVVHAHSVFSHSPLPVIEECFAHIGRVMRPGGFFDFTFDRTEGKEHDRLREDFYYRTETLVAAAARHGLAARFMEDWERLPHRQSKIRVTRG